jgi:hypothetical protein
MPQVVVTAVLVEGRSKSAVARDYGVSRRGRAGTAAALTAAADEIAHYEAEQGGMMNVAARDPLFELVRVDATNELSYPCADRCAPKSAEIPHFRAFQRGTLSHQGETSKAKGRSS